MNTMHKWSNFLKVRGEKKVFVCLNNEAAFTHTLFYALKTRNSQLY